MKLHEGEVSSLKEGLQEGRSCGRILNGSRKDKGVGDSSKASAWRQDLMATPTRRIFGSLGRNKAARDGGRSYRLRKGKLPERTLADTRIGHAAAL
jgi:hypothetical protein